MRTRMVDAAHGLRPVKLAAGLVPDEGVIRPAVPQALHNLLELAGPGVTLGMGNMRIAAEVAGLGGGVGCHQVPAGTAAREMIERGVLACHMVGLVVTGGGRGDQANALGHHAQRREQGQGFEIHRPGAATGQCITGGGNAVGNE